jgi:hypothetical protein
MVLRSSSDPFSRVEEERFFGLGNGTDLLSVAFLLECLSVAAPEMIANPSVTQI